MSTPKENIKKKLFIKLYSESDSRHLIPDGERASTLIQNLRRDEVKKIYIIAPNQSVSRPYKNLFQKQIPGIAIRDLVLGKIERQDMYVMKSMIDDINASTKIDQSCEIILFNEKIAGIVLACFYISAGNKAALTIEQVKKIVPNVVLSGSDLSIINEFKDFVQGVPKEAMPDLSPAAEVQSAETAGAPAVAEAKVRKREGGETKEFDTIRRFIDQTEPAGALSRFRIATKFIALVSFMLLVSLSLLIFLGTAFFKQVSESKINSSNATIAQLIADRMQDEIASYLEKARDAAGISSVGRPSEELAARVKEMLFRDQNNFIFMGIAVKEQDELKFKKTFYNEDYINESQVTKDTLQGIYRKNARFFIQSFKRKIIVRNVSPDAGRPILGVSFPYRSRGGSASSVIVCYLPLERFINTSRAMGPVRTYTVNDRGECIVDAERNRVLSRVSMADVPIVKKMLLSTSNNGAMRYRGSDGLYRLGSYRKLDMFGLGVIVTETEDSVLRGVYDIQRRNFIILAIILTAAVLGMFIFSRSISAPVEALKQLAATAPPGVLKLSAPGEGDEIFYLMQSFRGLLRSYLDSQEKLVDYQHAGTGLAGGTPSAAGALPPEPARDAMTQQFRTEGLKIQVTYDGPEVSMIWMGKGNLANPGELLNPYLEGIINSMRGRDLTCDFSSLESMNASIVQSIIKFANILDENRILARFVYNKSIDWQDASFEALSAVVQDMDTISLDGRLLDKNMFILP